MCTEYRLYSGDGAWLDMVTTPVLAQYEKLVANISISLLFDHSVHSGSTVCNSRQLNPCLQPPPHLRSMLTGHFPHANYDLDRLVPRPAASPPKLSLRFRHRIASRQQLGGPSTKRFFYLYFQSYGICCVASYWCLEVRAPLKSRRP